MNRELKIKVCGMRDPENIQELTASFPNYFGFIFYPKSKRYLGKNPDLDIFNQVPSSIKKVGVFVNENEAEVLRICKAYGLEVAQLHGSEPPEYCKRIQNEELVVFKAFAVNDAFDFSKLELYEGVVDYFLFDTKGKLPGGTGLKFNWYILKKYQLSTPFFLSGGIAPNDLESIQTFEHPALFGIDINSGFEIEPALKDVAKVKTFINRIKI